MKILKIAIIILWLVATTFFLMGALTTLEFRSKIVAYSSFFIFFNGIFILRYLLTDFIRFKPVQSISPFLISIIIATTYAYFPSINHDWKTQEILYREKSTPENVIAYQMEETGKGSYEHRTVKMIRITPVFDWVIELKKVNVNEDWVKVNDYVNELGIGKDTK